MELLNSKRLQALFEEHPADLALLKHDKPLAKTAAASHLKHLPAYLRDAAGMTKASHAGNRGRGERKRTFIRAPSHLLQLQCYHFCIRVGLCFHSYIQHAIF